MTVKATKVAMVTATRVAGNKEGDGDGDGTVMGDGDGSEGGGHVTATRAMATATTMTWTLAMATRVAGDTEGNGEGSKDNIDGDKGGGQVKGRWQGRKEPWQRRQRGKVQWQ